MRVRITKDDLLKTQLLEPGWYPCEITGYTEETSKKGDSVNMIPTFIVIGSKGKGAVLRTWFNEQGTVYMKNFLESIGAKMGSDGDFDVDLSEKTLKGKRLQVYITRGEYQGKGQNSATDYRPIGV